MLFWCCAPTTTCFEDTETNTTKENDDTDDNSSYHTSIISHFGSAHILVCAFTHTATHFIIVVFSSGHPAFILCSVCLWNSNLGPSALDNGRAAVGGVGRTRFVLSTRR